MQAINIAIVKIQRWWRRILDRNIFSLYKKLIKIISKCDSKILLKTFLSSDDPAADPAARSFIRFRLSGPLFPPTICFKVYTRLSVEDINANAPRYYAFTKYFDSKYSNIKADTSDLELFIYTQHIKHLDTNLRYKRNDNNTWTPLPNLFLNSISPLVYKSESPKTTIKLSRPTRCTNTDLQLHSRAKHVTRQSIRGGTKKNNKPTYFQLFSDFNSKPDLIFRCKDFLPQKSAKKCNTPAHLQLTNNFYKQDQRVEDLNFIEADAHEDLINWVNQLDYESYCKSWSREATSF